MLASSVLGAIDHSIEIMPESVSLGMAYPNPFNPVTSLDISLPDAQDVSIKIYNIKGQEISTLVSGPLNAGNHSFEWNASDQPSGLYIVRMVSGEYIDTQKLMLLK